MFESQPANDPNAQRVTRRVFLSTGIAAVGVALLSLRHPYHALAEDQPIASRRTGGDRALFRRWKASPEGHDAKGSEKYE